MDEKNQQPTEEKKKRSKRLTSEQKKLNRAKRAYSQRKAARARNFENHRSVS